MTSPIASPDETAAAPTQARGPAGHTLPLHRFAQASQAVFRYYGFDGEPRWEVTHPDGSGSLPVAYSEIEAMRKAHAIDVHNAIHRACSAEAPDARQDVPSSAVLIDHRDLLDMWSAELAVLGVPLEKYPHLRLVLDFESVPATVAIQERNGTIRARQKDPDDFDFAMPVYLRPADLVVASALRAHALSIAPRAGSVSSEAAEDASGSAPGM